MFKDCVNTGELTSRGAGQPGYCDPMLGQINGSYYLFVLENCKAGENVIAAAPASAAGGQAIMHTGDKTVYLKITAENQASLYRAEGATKEEKQWTAYSVSE